MRTYNADCIDLDLAAWSRVLRELPTGPMSEADFRAWLEGPLRRFFPFERFFCAYGSIAGGRLYMQSMLTSGFSAEFIASRDRSFDLNERGCMKWWLSHRRSLIMDKAEAMDAAGRPIAMTEREIDDVGRFSLGPLAKHGVVDPFSNTGTHMGFTGVPKDRRGQTLAVLELIAPVVHALYFQIKTAARSSVEWTALTDRQSDLIDLAAQGLSDKEIGLRLGISHNTVGNHFSAIYAKLGISKRSQLIALMK